MKVDYLAIKFTIFMISSRTKHESFDSFGSHTQLLMGNLPIFYVMSLSSILSFLFVFLYTQTYIRLDEY